MSTCCGKMISVNESNSYGNNQRCSSTVSGSGRIYILAVISGTERLLPKQITVDRGHAYLRVGAAERHPRVVIRGLQDRSIREIEERIVKERLHGFGASV